MTIKITFHKGGFVTMEPVGYTGSTCHQATRPYQEKFGGKQDTRETEGEEVAHATSQEQRQQAGN